jgi:hypothetical protein
LASATTLFFSMTLQRLSYRFATSWPASFFEY